MSVFVLLQGSCQDAWVWRRVIPLLRAAGHRVAAVDLPLSDPDVGASEYADAVVSALENLDEPPVLVGHSMAQASSCVATEAPPLRKWPVVPSQSIVCAEDRTLNPDRSRRASRRLLGVEAIEIPGGHCPFLARPDLPVARLAGVAAREPA